MFTYSSLTYGLSFCSVAVVEPWIIVRTHTLRVICITITTICRPHGMELGGILHIKITIIIRIKVLLRITHIVGYTHTMITMKHRGCTILISISNHITRQATTNIIIILSINKPIRHNIIIKCITAAAVTTTQAAAATEKKNRTTN